MELGILRKKVFRLEGLARNRKRVTQRRWQGNISTYIPIISSTFRSFSLSKDAKMASKTVQSSLSPLSLFQRELWCCECLHFSRNKTFTIAYDNTHATKESVSTSSINKTARIRAPRVGSNMDANMGSEHAASSSTNSGSALVHFSSPSSDAILRGISVSAFPQQ